MKKTLRLAIFSLAIMFPSFVYSDNGEISARIDVLEKTISSMQKSLINTLNDKKSSINEKDISKSLYDLSEEIKLLRSDIDRLEAKVKKYSTQNELFEKNTTTKISDIEKNLLKNGASSTTISNKDTYILSNINKEIEISNSDSEDNNKVGGTSESQVAQEYQKAYVLLKQLGADGKPEYENAITAFQVFINKFPNTPLRGNAYYWLGSIYTEQKQYSKAAIEFLNGYKANPKSGRAIDNLLGLSSSLIKINKNNEACSTINKIYNEFPNMNVTNKRHTDEMFNNAGCSNDN